jgi:hypothetical protein
MDFELIRTFSKPIHIGVGLVILCFGLVQLVLPKRGKVHRRAGRLYFWAIILSFLTSFPASVYTGNIFLASIGLFSLFLAFTGYRFAVIRERCKAQFLDRFAVIIFLLCATGMIAYALDLMMNGLLAAGIVLSIFGVIFLTGAWLDARYLLSGSKSSLLFSDGKWLRSHLGRMIGSYIAAVTAFLVNVEPFGSHLVNWLLPTIIGTLLIIRMTRRYAPSQPGK